MDRYEILSFLDEGGMQQVYRAMDHSFSRVVALKAPKTESALKRFDSSARLSARITHANVAKTLDYFEEGGRSFLVEELIQGRDLGKALKTDFKVFDPHLLAYFLHRFVKGLASAHHASVYHRDLKPSNIMVSDDLNLSTIKITDFGIARMAAQELEEAAEHGGVSLSSNQTAVGTLPYMSPESIENAMAASLPADVWAVGAISYKLLTGKFPFGDGLKAVTAIVSVNISTPNKPSGSDAFLPLWNAIWEIILACLKKDPVDRPTADQLLEMCSDLCYSDAVRRTGQVTAVRPKNGRWGYLVDEETDVEIFYHEDSVYGTLPKLGDRVLYAASPGNPNDRAFPVIVLRSGADV